MTPNAHDSQSIEPIDPAPSVRSSTPEKPSKPGKADKQGKRNTLGAATGTLVGAKVTQMGVNQVLKRAVDEEGNPSPALNRLILKTLTVQRSAVLGNLRRLVRRHPDDTPAQLADRLTRSYLNTVSTAGAAAGGTAVVPGVGTAAALALSAGVTVAFLELTALYAQSIAELQGIPTQENERGQALVMAVMLGEDGRRILRDAANQTTSGTLAPTVWLVSGASGLTDAIFKRLQRTFMRKLVINQGATLLGRAVPFGIGAVIGGVGNRKLGRSVVRSAQNLFGPFPLQLPASLQPLLTSAIEGEADSELEADTRSAE